MICIACPLGCRLTVTQDAGGEVSVSGNRCPKGELYAREEILAPKRIVTAVVRTDSTTYPYAPVRTDTPLPRALAGGLLAALYARRVPLPISVGEVLVEDVEGTGVKVLFTRTLPPEQVPAVGEESSTPSGRDSPGRSA